MQASTDKTARRARAHAETALLALLAQHDEDLEREEIRAEMLEAGIL